MRFIKSIFITATVIFFILGFISITISKANTNHLLLQEVNYKDFTKLDVSGVWDVEIKRGNKYKIVISSSYDMGKYIDIDKSNNVLYLRTKMRPWAWFRKTSAEDRISVKITLPELEKIEISGESTLVFNGFNADIFNLDMSGKSKITCKDNKIDDLFIENSGASIINCKNNTVENLSVESSGLSELDFDSTTNANVYLSGKSKTTIKMRGGNLSGHIDGKASLIYSGKANIQDLSTSGLGTITKK